MNRMTSKPLKAIAFGVAAISLAATVSAASLNSEKPAHSIADPKELKSVRWLPIQEQATAMASEPQAEAVTQEAEETASAADPTEAAPAQESQPLTQTVEARPLVQSAQPKPEQEPAKAESKPAEAPVLRAVPAKANAIVTSSGQTYTYKKVVPAVASAYTASAEENGGYAGHDYFGNSLQIGTIAVDPSVIPLGSKVYITGYSYDGLPSGGMIATASDIGGAIKGNRVDIFVPHSRQQALTFGKQNVQVYVLN
ncbi:3D domain-containing protein [Paenibacillus sp. J2TS4]|uniref:3D domain-containing protein n=1 Tax=Paenibacillus sp. J2TS4 TaxID=2807194 RepID=UPI001AFE5869|nr:3D domain-containing protein [Paenibacillus sp. J2TS4]GIP33018.1 hypothetical protein J2TS4_22280 [Paenibacillus sp. J2TS4]